jgi:gas vesicle protein
MLPIIIGALVGATIGAIAVSASEDDKNVVTPPADAQDNNSGHDKESSNNIAQLRKEIMDILSSMKSIH